MIIVLITRVKWEYIDSAEVRLFDSVEIAEIFCRKMNTGHQKYWTKADIIKEAIEVELFQPAETEE